MKPCKGLVCTVLCLFVLLLSSCTATEPSNKYGNPAPEKEQETAGNKGLEDAVDTEKGQDGISDMGYEITGWDEIRAKKEEYPELLRELDLKRLTLSDSLTVNIPEEVKLGSFVVVSGFEDRYEEFFSHYDNDYDEAYLIDEREKYYPSGFSYVNEEKNLHMSIGCTGFFRYSTYDFHTYMQMYFNEIEFIKTYTYAEAMETDDAYKLAMGSREVPVSDAAEKAREFADDFVSFSGYPHNLIPCRISLYKCEKGYYYDITYTQYVEGVGVLEYPPTCDQIYENFFFGVPNGYICSDEVGLFGAMQMVDEYKIEGKLEKTLDLTDALMYLEKKLAKNLRPEIGRIALEYIMVRGENIQKAKEGEKTDREKAGWANFCSYDIFEAKPCWVFYFDETEGKENYAVIDCTDMEVYYVDNKGRG